MAAVCGSCLGSLPQSISKARIGTKTDCPLAICAMGNAFPKMNAIGTRFVTCLGPIVLLLGMTAAIAKGQSEGTHELARVAGTICDAEKRPLEADVSLERNDHKFKFATRSDEKGRFLFEKVPLGQYEIRASQQGYALEEELVIVTAQKEPIEITILLAKAGASFATKNATAAIEFADEPHFTVAGVTDPTNLGGHGSDTNLRTREALAKETASLYRDGSGAAGINAGAAEESANRHTRLADTAESEGRPLDAVKEYQLAAEVEPNEAHLFAWGAELLLHRAFEPAIEVFSTGRKKYPDSVRMLLGLGVASYDQGPTERGAQLLVEACDLHPADPTPYLFLGRLQEAEKIEPPGWTEKFREFAARHPKIPRAHYLYAVALSKQREGERNSATIENELKRAIELDPRFGDAYLHLGILYSEKNDTAAAIAAFEKAIETSPLPDEAHYRLAQIYRKNGEAEKARKEMELYNRTSSEKSKEAEARRHEIQQFVYTLREKSAATPPKDSKPE
jgi:tetratricopeptide (TPR) repeat protein